MRSGEVFEYRGREIPSTKNLFRFSRKTGHKYPDKNVKAFYDWIMPQLEADREEFRKRLHMKPAVIWFTFYRGSRRKFDYINALQGVADAMVKAGLIDDDNADEFLPMFSQYRYCKENPGVAIKIG